MKRSRFASISGALVLACAGALCAAPAPQPVADAPLSPRPASRPSRAAAWSAALESFADAVCAADIEAAMKPLDPHWLMKSFQNRELTVREMIQLAKDSRLVSIRAYDRETRQPTRVASEIAADVNSRDFLPDAEKVRLTPPDAASMKEANEIAVRWMQSILNDETAPAGIIVLWIPKATQNQNDRAGEYIFILCQGIVGARGDVQIKLVVYGDPNQAGAPGH